MDCLIVGGIQIHFLDAHRVPESFLDCFDQVFTRMFAARNLEVD